MKNSVIIRLAQVSDAPELLKLNDLFNGEGCNSLSAIKKSLSSNEQEIVCIATAKGMLSASVADRFSNPCATASITER